MWKKVYRKKWLRLATLFLVIAILQFLLPVNLPKKTLAQTPGNAASACSAITAPLTAEEQVYAKTAWQYFVTNYQQATGFTNSTKGYPSGTLWDMGNYLTALNAARWLNLINQGEVDSRVSKFLTSLSGLKLFDDTLPNKVYNAATGQMVDYGNKPVERGIGWSALDIGRMLAAFHIIRTCHPQHTKQIQEVITKWKLDKSLKDAQLYGALVRPDGSTLLVQEGRLGYEEYAVRGYELWGFKANKAVNLEPFKFVDINGVKIPVDGRDYQTTQANNYVVSESYILDGIEFGLESYLKEYAARVLEAQKRRFDSTGQLTAVTEDNIDQPPYFLYNTVYANGVNWATITDENKLFPQLRSISTKAAFGWRYLYPNNAYAQQVFNVVKDLRSPEGDGFYAGLYEETKQPNKSLNGNTNGLILEILHFKARGNRPLIGPSLVSFAPMPSGDNTATTAQSNPPTSNNSPAEAKPSTPAPATTPPPTTTTTTAPAPTKTPTTTATSEPTVVAVAPIPSVGRPQSSSLPELTKPLTAVERRYAEAAWSYFKANYQPETGLVRDRSDIKAATLWGMGDYLAALHAARSLDIISPQEFDDRTRLLLGALSRLPLFAGELPQRGYDTRTLQPVDYGGNSVPEGTGFSALDIGRMMAALYNLKNYHPQYTNAVDKILLDWSYLRVVRDGLISSAIVEKDENGRRLTRVNSETRLGYEEYAARAFQLWGFDVNRSAVGGQYETALVEGMPVPIKRIRPDVNSEVNKHTISSPFLLYGLELGFDPQMRSLVEPIFKAEAERYRRTGKYSASGSTLINGKPYIIYNTIIGRGEPWATLAADGTQVPDDNRIVSTATAFAYHALFPQNQYARELFQGTTDLYNSSQGYYEGFYEKTGKTTFGLTSSTNGTILQSMLYMSTKQQPLIRPERSMNSPWWQEVSKGNSGRGLPATASQKAQLISDNLGSYWVTTGKEASPTAANK